MKQIILLLVSGLLHIRAHAQVFVNADGMCLRNDLSYTIDSSGIDSIAVYDPIDRKELYLTERRTEIVSINGIAPLSSNEVMYDNTELKKFDEHIAAFFTKTLEKISFAKATYRIHICGIVVDKDGKICKYEYHGLDYNDERGTPRDVNPIDPDEAQRIMASAPPLHPRLKNGKKANYAYIPEVILSRKYNTKEDKTVATELVTTPTAKHAHHTRKLDKFMSY